MSKWHIQPPARHSLPALVAAVPELTTARLRLRAPSLADVPLLQEINDSVADVSLRTGGEDGTWHDLVQMTATWLLRGHGWWTVEDAEDACGFVGLGFEPGDREPELGYLLASAARGKGYATEACAAARDYAWTGAHLPSLVSYISDDNAASQNVARKLGAARDAAAEAELHRAGETGVQVWRHPNPAGERYD